MVIIIGTVTVIISWVTLDKGLALYYRNMRTKLELRFRGVLGRPVELGSFQGLSLQGFHIGPSRVLASIDDQSQLNVEGLIVSLKPLASLQQGRWVVDLHLLNFRGDLWRNAKGSFWAIEPSEGSQPHAGSSMATHPEPSQFEIVQPFLGKLTEPDESRNLIGAEIRLHTLQIQGPGQLWIWLESEKPPNLAFTPHLAFLFEGRATLENASHGTVIKGEVLLYSGYRRRVRRPELCFEGGSGWWWSPSKQELAHLQKQGCYRRLGNSWSKGLQTWGSEAPFVRNAWEARDTLYPRVFEGQVILEHASHGTVVKGVEAEAFGAYISNKGEEFDERMHMGGLSFKSEGTPLNETWTIEMEGLSLHALSPLRESLRFSHPLVMDPPWRRSFIDWILSPGGGLVDGKIAIHKAKGGSCHGAIEVSDAWYGGITLPFIGIVDSLKLIDTLKLHCDGQQFQLASTGFRSSNDKLAGQISLVAGQLNLKASLQSPLQYEFSSQSINNHYLEVTGGELNSELHLFGPVTGLEGWINLTVSGVRSDIRGPFAFLIENSTTYLPPLKAQVQLASELSTQDFDFQVWGSLQAEAGESNLAVAGPLTPNLNLRSTTLKVAPRDWLPPTVSTYNLGLPYQPYEGQITVTQSATGKPRFSACLQETPIFLQQAGIKVCD